MSQHDMSIANQGFPAFRSDLNDALQALVSLNSGATAPSTTYANMPWYDTANNILKMRNEDNDAWISLFTLDQSADTLTAIAGKTLPSGTIVGTSDSQAFTNKTFSDDTTVNGVKVGRGSGSIATNTAVGASALQATTSGGYNTAVGYQAAYTSTTGDQNTAIGALALKASTGSGNTAIGNEALTTNTTGSSNTAIGQGSALSNTTGENNVAVGRGSLYANTTGSRNTSIGRLSLVANTTGIDNTALGYRSGYGVTTGSYNTIIGDDAGYSLSTGNANTFIGGTNGTSGAAGSSVTTGSNNTIIGAYNGNQGGLDIRTTNNYIVLSDGDGNPQLVTYNGGSLSLAGATPKAGTGITFPATQSASSDANTLDDYEEGTFTPAISGSGSSPTVTYSSRYGYYTKIGRMVFISFRVQVNTISGGSGAVQITGLPFTSASDVQHNLGGAFATGVAWGGSSTQLSPWVPANTTYAQFRGLINNSSNVDTEIAGVSNGDYLDAQGWYFV